MIPGNHDGPIDSFYGSLPKPRDIHDIAGVRFLPFLDEKRPNYCAERSATDIQRFYQARDGYDGPIVSLQHVGLFPSDTLDLPFKYTNADAIVRVMKDTGVVLSIGAHYHQGCDTLQHNGIAYVSAPSLCDQPFRFSVVSLSDHGVSSTEHSLAVANDMILTDWHVHTELAYCGEDVSVAGNAAFAEALGVSHLGIVEHSGQLYFNADTYWPGECFSSGIVSADPSDSRVDQFFDLVATVHGPGLLVGIEIDCDFNGNPLLLPSDKERADFSIGAIHRTPCTANPDIQAEQIAEEFLAMLKPFLVSGIDILAHPFRLFRRAEKETPPTLFEPTVAMLKESGTAAEINFHHNEPPDEFVSMCIDAGVKLTFGSDAHRLSQIGDFTRHFDLLERIGHAADYQDILLQPSDLALPTRATRTDQ